MVSLCNLWFVVNENVYLSNKDIRLRTPLQVTLFVIVLTVKSQTYEKTQLQKIHILKYMNYPVKSQTQWRIHRWIELLLSAKFKLEITIKTKKILQCYISFLMSKCYITIEIRLTLKLWFQINISTLQLCAQMSHRKRILIGGKDCHFTSEGRRLSPKIPAHSTI